MAVCVINVHGCVHVGVLMMVVGAAAAADESKKGESGEGKGKGEGSQRDDGGSPIRRTEQHHPEVAVSAPGRLRFRDESRGGKTRSAKVAAARSS